MDAAAFAIAATLACATGCDGAGVRRDRDTVGVGEPGPTGAGGGVSGGGDGAGGGGNAAACAVSTLLDAFVPTRTIFVAPNGSDAVDGLTEGTAWRTLVQASRLEPGDLVVVAPGSYPCAVRLSAQGENGRPIVVRGRERGTARFECAESEFGFRITASFVVLDGLVIASASEESVRIEAASLGDAPPSDVLLVRNRFVDAAGGHVRVVSARNIDLLRNELVQPEFFGPRRGGQAIDLVRVQGARLIGNVISDVAENAAIVVRGGATDVLLDGNVIVNAQEAVRLGGTGQELEIAIAPTEAEVSSAIVANTVVAGAVETPFSLQSCHDCLVANASVATTTGARAVFSYRSALVARSPSRNLRFVNNAFAFFASRPSQLFTLASEETNGLERATNLFFVEGASVSQIASTVPPAQDDLVDLDPVFLDRTRADLRLGDASPARGVGTVLPEVPRDATLACRPRPYNIGAY